MSQKKTIVIKYGGNAMINEEVKESVISNLSALHQKGFNVVVVHGGGPFIKNILDKVKISSEFIGGHRKTSKEAVKYIEMTLKGEVNTDIVTLISKTGEKAVGLSGKDGGLAQAKRRYHREGEKKIDLGQVGDIERIDPQIVYDLLDKGYIPVIACIASDKDGNTYNVNADMMAGAVAGALKADDYIVLTDIEGLRKDPADAKTLIEKISIEGLKPLFGNSIQGGMIPKIESCEIALNEGVHRARIVNGTTKDILIKVIDEGDKSGTIITK